MSANCPICHLPMTDFNGEYRCMNIKAHDSRGHPIGNKSRRSGKKFPGTGRYKNKGKGK